MSDIPLVELTASPPAIDSSEPGEPSDIYVVCRLGNDSQLAVDTLRNAGVKGVVKDLVGGLRAWAAHVDPQFPIY